MSSSNERYLEPYLQAARKFGAGFGSLLWASPRTQRARFEAIRAFHCCVGKILLDVGCGRADYLEYLLEHGERPAQYVGIEGVETLASAAEAKGLPGARILRADFVREPARLFVAADVIVFSGSLNTLRDDEFHLTVERAYAAAGEALVFNFLDSAYLAGREYLFWRRRDDVEAFARNLCPNVAFKTDYLQGDCTARLLKATPQAQREAISC